MVSGQWLGDALQHPPNRVAAVCLEDLFEIGGNAVARHAAVAQDEIIGLLFGDFGDDRFVDVVVEAGEQDVVVDVENAFALYRHFFDGRGERNAEFEHDLEQQIHRRAVGFDVAFHDVDKFFGIVLGAIVDVLHVRRIHSEDPKTDI